MRTFNLWGPCIFIDH